MPEGKARGAYQPPADGNRPPTQPGVGGARDGRSQPNPNLRVRGVASTPHSEPVTRLTEVDDTVLTGELATEFNGPGTLVDGKRGVPTDFVVTRDQVASRVEALVVPDLMNGRNVRVVDISGDGANALLERAQRTKDPVQVVPISTKEGGIFDYLDPRTHGGAASKFHTYPTERDERIAGELAGDIADIITTARIAQARAEQLPLDRVPRVSTKDIHDGLRLVRQQVDDIKQVDLGLAEMEALLAANLISKRDEQANTAALTGLDESLRGLIRHSEGMAATQPAEGGALVFSAGPRTGDPERDNPLRRVFMKAVPYVANGQGHVIVTDAGVFGDGFGDVFRGKNTDLLFDPARPKFASEVLPLLGVGRGFYSSPITDGPLSDAIGAKFGVRDAIEETSLGETGTVGRSDHSDTSYNRGSGGGSTSKANTGTEGDGRNDSYAANVGTGKVQRPEVRGEDLRALSRVPSSGVLRIGDEVALTTLRYGEQASFPERLGVVPAGVKQFLDTMRQRAKHQLESGQLPSVEQRTHAERIAAIRDLIPATSTFLDDVQGHGSTKVLTNEMKRNGWEGDLGAWMTSTVRGGEFWRGKIGKTWREHPDGQDYLNRERRRIMRLGVDSLDVDSYIDAKVAYWAQVANAEKNHEVSVNPRDFYTQHGFSYLYRPSEFPHYTNFETGKMRELYQAHQDRAAQSGTTALTPEEYYKQLGRGDIYNPDEWRDVIRSQRSARTDRPAQAARAAQPQIEAPAVRREVTDRRDVPTDERDVITIIQKAASWLGLRDEGGQAGATQGPRTRPEAASEYAEHPPARVERAQVEARMHQLRGRIEYLTAAEQAELGTLERRNNDYRTGDQYPRNPQEPAERAERGKLVTEMMRQQIIDQLPELRRVARQSAELEGFYTTADVGDLVAQMRQRSEFHGFDRGALEYQAKITIDAWRQRGYIS